MRELDHTAAPTIDEPDACRPLPKKRRKRKAWAVESRYIGPWSRRREWGVWGRYETEQRAEQACEQLRRTKSEVYGQPFYEFRVTEKA